MSVDISNYVANQTPAVSTIQTNNGGDALASGQASLDTSYQTFLTLLTTQLQNQDPTQPMDTDQFTQQLVQMTGVQQQLLTNNLLQQLVNQGGASVPASVGLIGKNVTATSSTAVLANGQASWDYTLPTAASQAVLTVSDSTGKVLWSGAAPSLSAGQSPFTWDGSGGAVNGQTYTLAVSAIDNNGATINATTAVTGTVTSVAQSNGATVLNLGGAQVPLSAVIGVTD